MKKVFSSQTQHKAMSGSSTGAALLAAGSKKGGRGFRAFNSVQSQLTGVYWFKQNKKWMAQISHNGKTLSMGYFISKVDAAKAYDAASWRLRGT